MATASRFAAMLPKAFFTRIPPLCSSKFHPHGSSSSSPSLLIRNAHNMTSRKDGDESAEALLRPGVAPVLPDEVIEVHSTVATVVPDGVSQTKSGVVTVVQQTDVGAGAGVHAKADKYWAPDPETGVFAPEEQLSNVVGDRGGLKATPHPTGNGSSVLEQTAWFRHVELEEVDRPPPVMDSDAV